MRIAYLVPGPMGRTPAGAEELARRLELLRDYARPGTEVGIADVAEGPASIESAYEEYLSIPGGVRRATELEAEGWEALILGCFGDPGLDAYREIVSVPVIGPGEAAALLACSLGHRFSIVTIADSILPATEHQIHNAGVGSALSSVRAINVPVLELHQDRDRTRKLTIEIGRRAVEEDGADTLILGCMSMGFLGIAEEVTGELGVPVINPARAALGFAEALVGSGLTHSRRAYMTPPKLAADGALSPADLFESATRSRAQL